MAAGPCEFVHQGRRYRRAERRPVEAGGKDRAIGKQQLAPEPSPRPPLVKSDSHSPELPRPPPAIQNPQPFQRYKPLPPIGAHTCPHQQQAPPSTVSVCVRLPDDRRVSCALNTASPLSSVVAAALAGSGYLAQDWTLCTSEVPKRELRDLSLSLQQSGLTHSCTLHLVPPDS